jgi:hypothetical protein
MNIPEMLTKTLASGDSISSIASMLGLGRDETSKAVSSSIPALLAAFTQTASTNKGAQQLANAAAEQDSSFLDNVTQTIASQGGQMATQGSSILGSLLGGGKASALGSILSRFSGVGEGMMGKILGLISPMILGFLGRQSGGGATGIASLLNGQKDYIRNAMPSGLASMLSTGLPGFGDIFGGATREAQAATAYAVHNEPQTRTTYDSKTISRPTPLRWAVPALIALGLLGLLAMWSRRGRVTEEAVPVARATNYQRNASPDAIGAPVRSITGGASSANFISDTSRWITDATKALADIRNGGSTDAAIEKIKQINSQLESSKSTWASLPDTTRTAAQNVFSPLMSKLEAATQSVLSMPGVGETVRPYVDQLLKNLKALTQTGVTATPPSP